MHQNVTPSAVRTAFLRPHSPRGLLILTTAAAIIYVAVLIFYFPPGTPILFWLLVAGQAFHLWQLFTYIWTVWDTSGPRRAHQRVRPLPLSVDIFITVAGEPRDVVEETARAAMHMRHPHKRVYLLNDGYVAGKENWREPINIARELGVESITRTIPGGAKAGNINHALQQTSGELVVVFDADFVPRPDFLEKTTGHFRDPQMGWVQTPQFYKNYEASAVTQSAWEQQELFYGPICSGKDRLNATTMCGTNMVIRRTALEAVGGMAEESIAEDFLTGLRIHARGWRSRYVAEVLAEGLAPHDLGSYYKQQFRWARGALDVIFRFNPIFMRGLTWTQRLQYLSSATFFFSGTVVLLHALFPLIFFYTGLIPLQVTGMMLATVFLPYMFLVMYTLQRTSNYCFTFHSLAFAMGAFNVHIAALVTAALGRTSAFSITPKTKEANNNTRYVIPQLMYVTAAGVGLVIALASQGLTASLANNTMWAILNIAIFITFARAAFPAAEPAAAPRLHPAPAAASNKTRV